MFSPLWCSVLLFFDPASAVLLALSGVHEPFGQNKAMDSQTKSKDPITQSHVGSDSRDEL